jgi:hypothetical protein
VCRKLKMGGVAWTPELASLSLKIKYWDLLLKRHQQRKVSTQLLARTRRQAGIKVKNGLTTEEIRQKLKVAKDAYYNYKKQHREKRGSYKQELATARVEAGLEKEATAVKNMDKREEQRMNARLIRFATHNLRSGSVTSVLAPDEEGEMRELHTQEEIEAALLKENHRRFNQAVDTPFLRPPLYDLIGPFGDTPTAQYILQHGCLPPGISTEGIDPHVIRILPFLKRGLDPGGFDLDISVDDHKQGWKKAKEFTSSGPSGLHFGHFKAGCQRDTIASLDASMTSVPFKSGYSPLRWQHGTNVMLVKQPGDFRVHRLRTILLYEADFNQNNKQLGRMMMKRAESAHLIAEEQYGSRKNRAAIDQCLNRQLSTDIFRQKRITGAFVATDALSCYDRIVHSFASLAMQRVGVPLPPIVSMFNTIADLHHYVRTSFGDSEVSFGGSGWVRPCQTVGQGNGAGPQIWCNVSTPILDAMRAAGHHVVFQLAMEDGEIKFVGYMFVDDDDNAVTADMSHPNPAQQAVERMQASLNDWEGGLRVTGGALAPEKCSWYLIHFIWKNGKWQYATVDQVPGDVTIRDKDGVPQVIQRLNVDKAERTLGVRLAPSGSMKTEFEFRRQKAREWGEAMRSGHLPRHLTWQSLTTCIMKTLEYPLPVTTFTREECTDIIAPVLKEGLSRSGMNRSMPRAVVYGPLRYQGIDLNELYVTQGAEHIFRCLNFGYRRSFLPGALLRATAQQTILEIGLPGEIFQVDACKWGKLATASWVAHTWNFLSQHGFTLRSDLPQLTTRRQKDKFLMAMFQEAGFRQSEMQALNRCRIYLQVSTLSDICTADSRKITEEAWNGLSKGGSKYHWPEQQLPPPKDWKIWQKALVKSLRLGKKGGTILGIDLQMGSWTDDDRNWSWFFAPMEAAVYFQKDHLQWFRHNRNEEETLMSSDPRFHLEGIPVQVEGIPSTWLRASVRANQFHLRLEGTAALSRLESLAAPCTFEEALRREPQSEWILENMSTLKGVELAYALAAGMAIGVSDGSYRDPFATAAWRIEGVHSGLVAEGVVLCPGPIVDHSPYRGELAGLYAMVWLVHQTVKFFNLSRGQVVLGCDGIGPLTKCFDSVPSSCADEHFDLICAVQRMIAITPITFVSHWVKGHQDDDPQRELDHWAEMNIDMDRNAKAHWWQLHDAGEPVVPQQELYMEPWSLYRNGVKIVRDFRLSIKDQVSGAELLAYWTDAKRFGSGSAEDIDWDVTEHAMRQLPPATRREVSKHWSGWFSHGVNMKRYKMRPSDVCPRCPLPEDASHIWKCAAPGAQEVWEDGVTEVVKWMRKNSTAGEIVRIIQLRLSEFRGQGEVSKCDGFKLPGLKEAVEKQDAVGWVAAFQGLWVKEWAPIQSQHYYLLGSRRTGKLWLSQLSRQLWYLYWKMWEHRNGILHDGDSAINDQVLNDKIRYEYHRGPTSVPAEARHHFYTPLAVLLQKQFDVRNAWLDCVRSSRALLDDNDYTPAVRRSGSSGAMARRQRSPRGSTRRVRTRVGT